jgi:hypothetical protein
VTEIGPVVAPSGTFAESSVSLTRVAEAVASPNFRDVALVKLNPSIVTGDPTGPSTGEKSVMTGPVALVKSSLVVKLFVEAITLIGPMPESLGGNAWIPFALYPVIVPAMPLNVTEVTDARLNPVIVTAVLESPKVGEKFVMIGPALVVKSMLEVALPLVVVTVIGPVVAPEGTVALISVVEVTVAVAVMPLNLTVVGGTKLPPEMTTGEPLVPTAGENPVMIGSVPEVKIFVLTLVPALVITVIGPVTAPGGTAASTSVGAM